MPRLLTATSHYELELNRSYVLGRAPECDIVVEDIAGSRRHAQLTVGRVAKAIHLQDLGSRNGTFVNDRQIEGRTPLLDRSRIRIGTTTYLLTLDENEENEEEGAGVDTATVAFEHLARNPRLLRIMRKMGRAGTEFAGQLDSFNVIDIVQLLLQTARSGTLHLETAAGHGAIGLGGGDVHFASFGESEGLEALLQLCRERSGLFWLAEGELDRPRSIDLPGSTLLYEVCVALEDDGSL